jgi:multiple sugar transport system ATP-binding protein
MKDGVLQQVEQPQALYDEPDNLFVASFIGSPAMNLVVAILTAHSGVEGRVHAVFGPHRLVVPDTVLDRRPGARAHLGGPVVLGIRPEDLEDIEFAPRAGPDEVLEVTVTLAEPLGAEVIGHFDTGAPNPDGTGTAVFSSRLHPRTAVRAGRTVKLAVDVERLHLFDPATGRAIR